MTIIIFGGGISGLTVAHLLIKKGLKVEIYESEPIIGGMARSIRDDHTNIPTEHSWRGYAPFYRNFFNIAKQIPVGESKNVYDNLSDRVKFQMLGKKGLVSPKHGIIQTILVFHILGRAILSDQRNKTNYKIALAPILKKRLSKQNYDYFIKFLMGPGWGMDKDTASIGHYAKFTEFNLFQSDGQVKWQVMRGPTQEMWFDPWKKLLQKEGVQFHMNSVLKYINFTDNNIKNCVLSDGRIITGSDYVFCINPFNLEKILHDSAINNLSLELYKKQHLANDKSDYEMIAFIIAFSEKVDFSYPSPAFITVDGPLTITFYPQDYLWNSDIDLGEGVKSLWSGTCITTHDTVELYQKKGIDLSITELKKEILHEILSSPQIREKPGIDSIIDIKIWYEWKNVDGKLKPKYLKYANNIYNQEHRIDQITSFENMYIGGAHTKTSIDIWSMEGAVESGIRVGNHILEKYKKDPEYLHEHTKTKGTISAISKLDNIFYKAGLPHIIDVLLILIIIILAFILIRKMIRKMLKK